MGNNSLLFESANNIAALKLMLEERWPDLVGRTYSIAVNKHLASDNTEIKEGDEIALMPPFSGG